jgi:hypothetical protein
MARKRLPAVDVEPGVLPEWLASGPASYDRDDVTAWRLAGSEWSLEHGCGRVHSDDGRPCTSCPNGWLRLLSRDVREAASPRGRARRLGWLA